LKHYDEEWLDSVPITKTVPFEFTDVSEQVLESFKERIRVNVDATVEQCVKALLDNFDICPEYDAETARAIAGVRYEMRLRDFSHRNRFTLAEDISFDALASLKEHSASLPGIDIIEEPLRIYHEGFIGAHMRGSIGRISAEEYAELREQGYDLNDTIGKNGIEFAMESVLRGDNGTRTIVRNSRGVAVSDDVTTAARPGNSVMLTINSRFQNDLQEIVKNHIKWLRTLDQTYDNTRWNRRGINTQGGAVAVIEVKTGRVLGLASYPTYDINDYLADYDAVLNAELNPLYDRATMGQYRPGSAFKTITSVAGLYNNTIDRNSAVHCGGTYGYFNSPTWTPRCHSTHGSANVVRALDVSCNIFYYDVGRRMGIDALVEAAMALGIGNNLGLEISTTSGRMTTPEIFESLLGRPISGGDTIQAAIGQSETLVSPLHLAVAAATIANNGERYKPFMIDSVWSYDRTELIYKTEPHIVSTFAAERPDVYEAVRAGMLANAPHANWPLGGSSSFDFLPSRAAFKTGTAQAPNGTYNSVVMGYYPYDEPEIAFGVIFEDSEWSRNIIRNIIDAYFYDAYEPDINADGLIASPWKRWDEQKRQRLTGL
jgi:penicillin-binding protein 2